MVSMEEYDDDESEDLFMEPELVAEEDSEIEATVMLENFSEEDGMHRPIFINQSDGEMLTLTLEENASRNF